MAQIEITLDAKNKKPGRFASEVAYALRGKTSANFLPNSKNFPKVTVKNVDDADFSEKKLKESFFSRYSGYPSGRNVKSAFVVAQKDKREVLKKAILGMLPKNKLRKIMIKNLILKHGEDK